MNKAEAKRFVGRVRELSCVICGSPGTAHHVRKGGEKKDDRKCFNLCPFHHQVQYGGDESIHGARESWQKKHGSEASFVELTYELLGVEPDEDVRIWIERWKVV